MALHTGGCRPGARSASRTILVRLDSLPADPERRYRIHDLVRVKTKFFGVRRPTR